MEPQAEHDGCETAARVGRNNCPEWVFSTVFPLDSFIRGLLDDIEVDLADRFPVNRCLISPLVVASAFPTSPRRTARASELAATGKLSFAATDTNDSAAWGRCTRRAHTKEWTDFGLFCVSDSLLLNEFPFTR